MFAAHIATHTLSHVSTMAVWLFQDQPVAWDPISLWKQMGFIARSVVVILFIMSGWSIGVMIDRAMAFSAARKQSRAFAPAVAGALRDGKIDEAIKVAERNKKSHLAKVVTAGLMEFRAHQESGEIPGETIEASKRALERTEALRDTRIHMRIAAGQPAHGRRLAAHRNFREPICLAQQLDGFGIDYVQPRPAIEGRSQLLDVDLLDRHGPNAIGVRPVRAGPAAR